MYIRNNDWKQHHNRNYFKKYNHSINMLFAFICMVNARFALLQFANYHWVRAADSVVICELSKNSQSQIGSQLRSQITRSQIRSSQITRGLNTVSSQLVTPWPSRRDGQLVTQIFLQWVDHTFFAPCDELTLQVLLCDTVIHGMVSVGPMWTRPWHRVFNLMYFDLKSSISGISAT